MNKHITYLAAVAWANGGTLFGADLRGAYLSGAYLSGAKYRDDTIAARIATVERMDGYTFHLLRLENGAAKVMAGCRWLTVDKYRAHVAKEYPNTPKARETLDILDFFEKRIETDNV